MISNDNSCHSNEQKKNANKFMPTLCGSYGVDCQLT